MSNDRDVRILQKENNKLREENQTMQVQVKKLTSSSSFLTTKSANLSNQIHKFVTGELKVPKEEEAFIKTCAKILIQPPLDRCQRLFR